MSVHGSSNDPRELIFGQADARDPMIGPAIVVNPNEVLPTGWGAPNDQLFQTGANNNVRTVQSLELGHGVGPERKAGGHYPYADLPNPFRRTQVMQRDGQDAYSLMVYRPERPAIWTHALAVEQQYAPVKARQRETPIVNQVPSVPYVTTVPEATAPPASPGGYW